MLGKMLSHKCQKCMIHNANFDTETNTIKSIKIALLLFIVGILAAVFESLSTGYTGRFMAQMTAPLLLKIMTDAPFGEYSQNTHVTAAPTSLSLYGYLWCYCQLQQLE